MNVTATNQDESFDYIIVGGGLCGLVVATRLSEDPDVSVCVIEAGGDLTERVQTQTPGRFKENFRCPETDWAFKTSSQQGAGGRAIDLPRGKGLGGSSCLNLMQYGRASAHEYDAFEKLGNKGWNWAELMKYFVKSERLCSTPDEQKKYGLAFGPSFHGTDGPIPKVLPRVATDAHFGFLKAAEAVGIPVNKDSSNGDQIGVWTGMETVDPDKGTRASSASAYYLPNKSRNNLTVITDAQATKVNFKKSVTDDLVEADGVDYTQDGTVKTVSARKEVILSSGSFQTPQLLELSGIGSRKILSEHNIPVIVELPGVGCNLQDHIWFPVITELDKDMTSFDNIRNSEGLKKELDVYARTKGGVLAESGLSGFVFAPVKMFMDKEKILETTNNFDIINQGDISAGVKKGLEIQKEWIGRDDVPDVEIILGQSLMGALPSSFSGEKHATMIIALMHPFSRGSVHIGSPDPLISPTIDHKFLQNPIDIKICVEVFKLARKIFATEPLKSMTVKEVVPGELVKTDEEIESFIRKSFQTVYHPMGTASMLPREDGGVVDLDLRVYGTKNPRVVDMSIFPIQIAAHPQSTLYAVAEKAADIIKGVEL